MVLLGALVAACAPSIRMGVPPGVDAPGERFALALDVLHELIGSASAISRGLTAEQIAQAIRVDPLRLEPVLDALVAIDWIGRLHEFSPGGGRYVLLCDPDRAGVQPLVGRLLLAPAPALGTFWRRAGFDRATLAQIVEPPPDAPPVP
jgi:membrane protein